MGLNFVAWFFIVFSLFGMCFLGLGIATGEALLIFVGLALALVFMGGRCYAVKD